MRAGGKPERCAARCVVVAQDRRRCAAAAHALGDGVTGEILDVPQHRHLMAAPVCPGII